MKMNNVFCEYYKYRRLNMQIDKRYLKHIHKDNVIIKQKNTNCPEASNRM